VRWKRGRGNVAAEVKKASERSRHMAAGNIARIDGLRLCFLSGGGW
jgi:hypothetical protein